MAYGRPGRPPREGGVKLTSIALPIRLYKMLKRMSVDLECSMNKIIIRSLYETNMHWVRAGKKAKIDLAELDEGKLGGFFSAIDADKKRVNSD